MKTMKTTSTLTAVLLVALFASVSSAQVKFGMDLYSHYVWRGADLSAQSLQPSITYTTGGLSVGAWASYSTIGTYSENDLWASYSVGPVSVYFTDYYVPSATTAGFFNYANNGGAHTLEGGLGYTGPAVFPVTVAAYYNLSGDADNSAYIQASYPFTIDTVTSLSVFVGGTPSRSITYYGTTKGTITNFGLTFSKTVKVTESFSLPFNASYIINPYTEKSYLVFGISL